MNAGAFDTLSAARELEAAGVARPQAEAIAKAIAHGDERAATKSDLDTAVAGVRMDITAVRSELATIRWTIGLLAAFMFAIGLRVFGIL